MHNFNDLDPKLCTYCGTCVAVCPMNSLIADNEKIQLVGKCNSFRGQFYLDPGPHAFLEEWVRTSGPLDPIECAKRIEVCVVVVVGVYVDGVAGRDGDYAESSNGSCEFHESSQQS